MDCTIHSQPLFDMHTISCYYSTNLHLNTRFIKHMNCIGRNSYHTLKPLLALVERQTALWNFPLFYFKELTSFKVFHSEKLRKNKTKEKTH